MTAQDSVVLPPQYTLAGDQGGAFQDRPDLNRYGVSCRNMWLRRTAGTVPVPGS